MVGDMRRRRRRSSSCFLTLSLLLLYLFVVSSSRNEGMEETEVVAEREHSVTRKLVQTLATLSEDVHAQLQTSIHQLRSFLTQPISSGGGLAAMFLSVTNPSTPTLNQKSSDDQASGFDDGIEIGRPPNDKFQLRSASDDNLPKSDDYSVPQRTRIVSVLPRGGAHLMSIRDNDTTNSTNVDTTRYRINSCSNVGKSVKANDATVSVHSSFFSMS